MSKVDTGASVDKLLSFAAFAQDVMASARKHGLLRTRRAREAEAGSKPAQRAETKRTRKPSEPVAPSSTAGTVLPPRMAKPRGDGAQEE